jgi:hypothetical protein
VHAKKESDSFQYKSHMVYNIDLMIGDFNRKKGISIGSLKTIMTQQILFLFAITSLLSFHYPISAQTNYKIENYTSDEGLSHNNVKCIIQDTTGFI